MQESTVQSRPRRTVADETRKSFCPQWFPQQDLRQANVMLAGRDRSLWGRLTQTALEHSQHLGWAEIRHPYHPLHGQRFPVLKKRRIAGNETLILRGLDCGTFSIARDWTDWADPSPADSLKLPLRRLDAESLLALVTLLEQLPQQSAEKS